MSCRTCLKHLSFFKNFSPTNASRFCLVISFCEKLGVLTDRTRPRGEFELRISSDALEMYTCRHVQIHYDNPIFRGYVMANDGDEKDKRVKDGRDWADFPPVPLSDKGDQVFCPAFDRRIDDGLCWECCMAEQGGPTDTAAQLRRWVAESQRFASIAEFQQVCALCPHCAWRPSASAGSGGG
jgi:hypothetical protein